MDPPKIAFFHRNAFISFYHLYMRNAMDFLHSRTHLFL